MAVHAPNREVRLDKNKKGILKKGKEMGIGSKTSKNESRYPEIESV